MGYIEWTQDLSVGVPELDAQHQRWIGMINELHDTLLHGDAEDLVAITGRMLRAMGEYVEEHFRTEEAYMEKIGFPGLDAHREVHHRSPSASSVISLNTRTGLPSLTPV